MSEGAAVPGLNPERHLRPGGDMLRFSTDSAQRHGRSVWSVQDHRLSSSIHLQGIHVSGSKGAGRKAVACRFPGYVRVICDCVCSRCPAGLARGERNEKLSD